VHFVLESSVSLRMALFTAFLRARRKPFCVTNPEFN